MRSTSSLESPQLDWPVVPTASTPRLTTTVTPRRELARPVTLQPDRSYGQILNSSVLIGGSSLLTNLAAILRNKFVAVFLGPAGIGLMGLLGSMTSMVGTLAGLGVTTSGVREIAEASGAGDHVRVARTVTTLRRIMLRLPS